MLDSEIIKQHSSALGVLRATFDHWHILSDDQRRDAPLLLLLDLDLLRSSALISILCQTRGIHTCI